MGYEGSWLSITVHHPMEPLTATVLTWPLSYIRAYTVTRFTRTSTVQHG